MTTDQLLYVTARIHDWDRDALDIVKRAIELTMHCEQAEKASEKVKAMMRDGCTSVEMLIKAMRDIGISDDMSAEARWETDEADRILAGA